MAADWSAAAAAHIAAAADAHIAAAADSSVWGSLGHGILSFSKPGITCVILFLTHYMNSIIFAMIVVAALT
jgi:hypothetical protein